MTHVDKARERGYSTGALSWSLFSMKQSRRIYAAMTIPEIIPPTSCQLKSAHVRQPPSLPDC